MSAVLIAPVVVDGETVLQAGSTLVGKVRAATRDIDFAYMRPGRRLSHKIEGDIDRERDKVAYDLAFSSCGNILDWTDRADFPRFARNATGDPIVTDGRMVVIVPGTNCCAPIRFGALLRQAAGLLNPFAGASTGPPIRSY